MKKLIFILFGLPFLLEAQNISPDLLHKELSYYLPKIDYDKSITSPEEFLGFQIGEWHVSHDKLVQYMQLLAKQSDRIEIETYAYSHEQRPLLLLTISNPKNINNISKIKQEHRILTDASKSLELNLEEMPIVIYQGYSIHGNESSGSNAAMLIAYYLAAGRGQSIDQLLEKSVILLDPCYNPDGFQRFSTWANMNKSYTLVSDPADREYHETWPGGRTNHYWFDLNRDWLLLTHPESQGRIKNFHEWNPNILTDHHEMGTNSTFFFQPGVPERTNPNTPERNQILTEKIGHFHAKALDKIGSMYYTKESFDDYYYGKGSTYPDIHGGIGILFEQASSRGHFQESINGIVSFPFTIRNQVVTSLSTQEAAIALKDEIMGYQRDFYVDVSKNQNKTFYKIPKGLDYNKASQFIEILLQHDIEVLDDLKNEGYFYVNNQQKQNKLIKTIFETVNAFKVHVFYDVSTWTFPLAFNLEVEKISNLPKDLKKITSISPKKVPILNTGEQIVAYAFDWNDTKSAPLLTALLDQEIVCRSILESFTAETSRGEKIFGRGTIVIPNQSLDKQILQSLSNQFGIELHSLLTGFNSQGVMLGSPQSIVLEPVKALMIIGEGINAYDAGEIWHHFDTRLNLALSKVELARLSSVDLNRYNTIIFPDGRYTDLSESAIDNLTNWVNKGGQLIAFKRAIQALSAKKILQIEIISDNFQNSDDEEYSNRKEHSTKHLIGGAIFETEIDTSFPLFYGYQSNTLPVFKKGNLAIKVNTIAFKNPMTYTQNPLLSGYCSLENLERIKNSSALGVYSYGKGKIICSVDNPLFRGYWVGGHKLFDNMLYFTKAISN